MNICLAGFRINMRNLAKERRFLTYGLCFRIKDNQTHTVTLLWESILHGNLNTGEPGVCKELSVPVLRDKIAQYLNEFHVGRNACLREIEVLSYSMRKQLRHACE